MTDFGLEVGPMVKQTGAMLLLLVLYDGIINKATNASFCMGRIFRDEIQRFEPKSHCVKRHRRTNHKTIMRLLQYGSAVKESLDIIC